MFTILKAKTHYDVALTHQNLQWFWFLFLTTKSPAPQIERNIYPPKCVSSKTRNHNYKNVCKSNTHIFILKIRNKTLSKLT